MLTVFLLEKPTAQFGKCFLLVGPKIALSMTSIHTFIYVRILPVVFFPIFRMEKDCT